MLFRIFYLINCLKQVCFARITTELLHEKTLVILVYLSMKNMRYLYLRQKKKHFRLFKCLFPWPLHVAPQIQLIFDLSSGRGSFLKRQIANLNGAAVFARFLRRPPNPQSRVPVISIQFHLTVFFSF